ncbi:MAG: cytochrome c [Sphingobacteriaceae bacterium]|nr:cytochrome c [Sphingobacteriaceae bacterium]
MLISGFEIKAEDGKKIFKQNCGVCHTTTQQKLVGPGLEGVGTKFSEDWLIKWIKDSQALVNSGDALAVKAFEEGNKIAMPPFANLSDQDIKDILSFIATDVPAAKEAPGATPDAQPVVAKNQEWTTLSKVFLGSMVIIILFLGGYLVFLKKQLNKLGYVTDSVPFKDQVEGYIKNNGKFILFVCIILGMTVMKSCISEIM